MEYRDLLLFLVAMATSLVYAKPMLTPEVKAMLSEAKKEVQSATAQDVNAMIQNGNVVVVDIRDPNEWEKGTIKSDKLVKISRGFLEVKYPKLILDKYNKNDQFVVYCGIEPRSILATQTLQKLGFKNVKYLKGGFKNWKASGLPVSQ